MPSGNVRIFEETQAFAEITVNGQVKGKRPINGHPTLKEFCQGLAKEFGLSSFNVTLDGAAVTKPSQADAPVQAGSKVDVSAKDSRAVN